MPETYTVKSSEKSERLDIPLEKFDSPTLTRIIEEIRNDQVSEPNSAAAYNRTYHRHNR